MRIDNSYLSGPRPAPADGTTTPSLAGKASDGGSQADAASSHAPSPELAQLVGRVQESPEVRADRVLEVSQRLAGGYYSTPEAADRTAQALLQQGEQ